MNKAKLVENIAEKQGLTKAESERIVEQIIDEILTAVSKKDEVSIAGFGAFSARKRAARKGRNPKTGEAIQIPASTSPKFKAAKAFKDAVN